MMAAYEETIYEDKTAALQQYMIEYRYSLRPIILFANIDVSKHVLVVDTFIFVKSIISQRKYKFSSVASTLGNLWFCGSHASTKHRIIAEHKCM
jgi:hypothetical protein